LIFRDARRFIASADYAIDADAATPFFDAPARHAISSLHLSLPTRLMIIIFIIR